MATNTLTWLSLKGSKYFSACLIWTASENTLIIEYGIIEYTTLTHFKGPFFRMLVLGEARYHISSSTTLIVCCDKVKASHGDSLYGHRKTHRERGRGRERSSLQVTLDTSIINCNCMRGSKVESAYWAWQPIELWDIMICCYFKSWSFGMAYCAMIGYQQ